MINDVWLKVFDQKFSRTCSLPWRKRHQVWPWWQRRLERGGWCWIGMCYSWLLKGPLKDPGIGPLYGSSHALWNRYKMFYLLSGHNNFWGLNTNFCHFYFLESKILINWLSEPDYIAGFWWSSICWFTRINHGFITFNRGSIADLVLLSPDCNFTRVKH